MKSKITSVVFPLIILLSFTFFMLFFSYSTSPVYPNFYGNDSAFFRFMGLSLRKGKILYTDIWDNKGPVLFFIQALGTIGGVKNDKLSGIFVLQILSGFFSFFLMWQADKVLNTPNKEKLRFFSFMICAFTMIALFFEGGNCCEERCLPLISMSLLLMTFYASSTPKQTKHPLKFAFFHGINLGLIAFIRINNAISICAGVLVIGIYLIYNKQLKNLLLNIVFGFLGIAIVIIPIMLFFYKNDALTDMINAIFLHNLKYISARTYSNFNGMEILIRYAPLIISMIMVLLHIVTIRQFHLIDGLLLSMLSANFIMLTNNNIYLHYFVIIIPLITLVLSLTVKFSKKSEIILTLCLFIPFVYESIKLIPTLYSNHVALPRYQSSALIPKNERSSSIAIWTPPDIYLHTGLEPCSRYCAYQDIHFGIDPSMKDEFIKTVLSAQPTWIIKPCGGPGVYSEIENLLAESYISQFSELGLCFYRRE